MASSWPFFRPLIRPRAKPTMPAPRAAWRANRPDSTSPEFGSKIGLIHCLAPAASAAWAAASSVPAKPSPSSAGFWPPRTRLTTKMATRITSSTGVAHL